MTEIERNKVKSIMISPTARPNQREWEKVKVMLPIVREGVNSLYANGNEIVHNTFNLTGFSIDKIRTENHLSGNDQ